MLMKFAHESGEHVGLPLLRNIALVDLAHGGNDDLIQSLGVGGNGALGGSRVPKAAKGSRRCSFELAAHTGSSAPLARTGSTALLFEASLECRGMDIMEFPKPI